MAAQLNVVAEAGHRRRALLAQARPPVETQRLSMADVRTLQADRSPAARAAVARKLGGQIDELITGDHAQLAEAVLQLLVRDAASTVRATLAEAVAPSPNLPRALAAALAGDDIEVARPLLERSPVLGDAELCRIVRSSPPTHAVAVAARGRLSEELADALIGTGDRQVVVRLLANGGARLSPAALERVADDWRDDAAVQERLAGRAELPLELVERLMAMIDDRLLRDPARTSSMTPEQAGARIRATRERAMAGSGDGLAGRALQRRLREQMTAGEITHDSLVGHLRDGDLVSFEVGLSLMARLDLGPCRRLLYHDDRRHVAALCAKAGVPTPHYLMLRRTLDPAPERAPETDRGGPDEQAARSMLEAYEQMRRDPEAVDRLCYA